VAVDRRVRRTRAPASVAAAVRARPAGIPAAAVCEPRIAARTGLDPVDPLGPVGPGIGWLPVSVTLAIGRGVHRLGRLAVRLLRVRIGAGAVAITRPDRIGPEGVRPQRIGPQRIRAVPVRAERIRPAFVLLAGPARRRVGTAVGVCLGPQRVRRAGQRILVRADRGARPPAGLGGLMGGASRLGGWRRLRRYRVGLRRDRSGGGRLDRSPVVWREAGLRMRARALGHASPAVPAAPVITRVKVGQRAGTPFGHGVRLSGAGGRRQRLVGCQVIPELLVGNPAERLGRPQFLVHVRSLAPSHPPT